MSIFLNLVNTYSSQAQWLKALDAFVAVTAEKEAYKYQAILQEMSKQLEQKNIEVNKLSAELASVKLQLREERLSTRSLKRMKSEDESPTIQARKLLRRA